MRLTKVKTESLIIDGRRFIARVQRGHDFPVLSKAETLQLCRYLGYHDFTDEPFIAKVNDTEGVYCLDTRPHFGHYHYWRVAKSWDDYYSQA